MKDAPAAIRSRYMGDRNFDPLIVGSASKPIWAAAALERNSRLYKLKVKGEKSEDSLFGVRIPQEEWEGTPLGGWTNFTTYLAESSNSYQIRLNFLALAESDPSSTVVRVEYDDRGRVRRTSSDQETFAEAPWNLFPDLHEYGFTSSSPSSMYRLETNPLATTLQEHFPLQVTAGTYRPEEISFWSGDEKDNRVLPEGASSRNDPWARVAYISPATTNLDLGNITSTRQYISTLLGGGSNRWSNVDLASGIYTAFSGKPIVPHIGDINSAVDTRTALRPDTAAHVREGMMEMVKKGTGQDFFSRGDWSLSKSLGPGYEFYAKTGTLDESEHALPSLARVVLVIVPTERRAGRPRSSLILSLVIEHGGMSDSNRSNIAVKLLAQFISQNANLLKEVMNR
jgi:cell division protein FtsI/penicillin-binding protein 2